MAKVYVSDVIDQPIEKVWAVARDFNGHHAWHPLIADSHVEDGQPADRVGCVRNFHLANGAHLREMLLSFSDLDHCFTYNILESPLPLANYVATFRCTPVTEGDRTFVEWSAEFDAAPDDVPALKQQVGRNTFADGILALAKAVVAAG
ncbi:MAG: SRPBCC family protein [Alphaproteobacteria bacterium]